METKTLKLQGFITDFFETGCEGLIWIFQEDNKTGYDGMHVIEEGDHLKIFGKDGAVLFDGKIEPDYKVGYRNYPLNPEYGQPCALGFWIHWTQKGWTPDDWARLFLRGSLMETEGKYLRAEFIKAEEKN